jgi:hypothetical protein
LRRRRKRPTGTNGVSAHSSRPLQLCVHCFARPFDFHTCGCQVRLSETLIGWLPVRCLCVQAWAASYASTQKLNERNNRPAPGTATSAAAAAAAKRNTTSVVMTLPSPSKLRSSSARSATLGTRSSEGTASGSSSSRSNAGAAGAIIPPASPPRWRRDRFQVRPLR